MRTHVVMKNINSTSIRRAYYHIRNHYLTANNIVVVVGLIVAASWAWGSVQAMERNFALQKEVDYKQKELQLAKLEKQKLEFEQNYFKSDEYKELAVREKLGLINPGEQVLILPKNTVSADDEPSNELAPVRTVPVSNLQQWVNYLFGGAYRNLHR